MNKYISKKLSKKFCELFNRHYCFHKHEVLFCEEREVSRFDNVNLDDHKGLVYDTVYEW